MRPRVWDDVAESFHDSVLSPLDSDKSGILKRIVIASGGPKRRGIDLGCGVGRWIPLLSRHFASVVGVDFSTKCLAVARRKHSRYKNVTFLKCDLGSPALKFRDKFHFVVSCNSLLDGNYNRRRKTLLYLSSLLHSAGVALLIVPSLESFLYTRFLEARGRRALTKRRQISTIEGEIAEKSFLNFAGSGVIEVDGEPTKYFLQAEIVDLVQSAGLAVREIFKIEYAWPDVSDSKNSKGASSQPWDWGLVISHKKSGKGRAGAPSKKRPL
ncbi:MAG: methyltransferase domain-containing protein [Tepidisphaeraceae bacterium]|jgi:SAM-dependent methyltransferase